MKLPGAVVEACLKFVKSEGVRADILSTPSQPPENFPLVRVMPYINLHLPRRKKESRTRRVFTSIAASYGAAGSDRRSGLHDLSGRYTPNTIGSRKLVRTRLEDQYGIEGGQFLFCPYIFERRQRKPVIGREALVIWTPQTHSTSTSNYDAPKLLIVFAVFCFLSFLRLDFIPG